MGDRPMLGSSIIISLGLLMSARAMASICCSPPESVPASCLRRSLSRGNRVNTSSTASSGALPSMYAPISMFSITLMCANTRLPSGTCTSPLVTILFGSMCAMSLPMNSIVPDFGCIRPDTVLSMVLLPAPFAPIRETISPSFTSKLTPLTACIFP